MFFCGYLVSFVHHTASQYHRCQILSGQLELLPLQVMLSTIQLSRCFLKKMASPAIPLPLMRTMLLMTTPILMIMMFLMPIPNLPEMVLSLLITLPLKMVASLPVATMSPSLISTILYNRNSFCLVLGRHPSHQRKFFKMLGMIAET